MKLYIYECIYQCIYTQRGSSEKIHTQLVTVITLGEENKIGGEVKSLFLTSRTSVLFEYFVTRMCLYVTGVIKNK